MGSVIGSYKKITCLVVVRVGTECLGMPTILPGSFPWTYSAFSSWLHSTELGWCSGSDVQMEGRKRVDSEQGLPAHWPLVRPWWCHTRAVLARLVSDPTWDGGHVAQESLGRQLWWVEFSGRPGVGRITEMTFCSLLASSGVSSSRKLALTFQSGGCSVYSTSPWLCSLHIWPRLLMDYISVDWHMDCITFFCVSVQFWWKDDRQENFFPYNQNTLPGNHGMEAAVASPRSPLLTYGLSSHFLFPYPWHPALGKS